MLLSTIKSWTNLYFTIAQPKALKIGVRFATMLPHLLKKGQIKQLAGSLQL